MNPPSLLQRSLALPSIFVHVTAAFGSLFGQHTKGDLNRISKGLGLMGGWGLLPCRTCAKEKKSLEVRAASPPGACRMMATTLGTGRGEILEDMDPWFDLVPCFSGLFRVQTSAAINILPAGSFQLLVTLR